MLDVKRQPMRHTTQSNKEDNIAVFRIWFRQ